MSFNKIIMVAHLGRDPELKYTTNGQAVCTFSAATTEKRKEGKEATTWFRVTLWGKQAEAADKYLSKGRQVYIEGRLRLEEWQDREGKTRQSLEVFATDMQFIGGNDSSEARENRETKRVATVLEPEPDENDIPF